MKVTRHTFAAAGLLLPLIALVTTVGCRSGGSRGSGGPEADSGDAVREEDLVLITEWIVGDEPRTDEPVFGRVGYVTVDDDGFVYATDAGERTISVFGPEGEFVRHVGRRGSSREISDCARFVVPGAAP